MIGYWQTNWDEEYHEAKVFTLGQAASDLLTRYSQSEWPNVGGDYDELVFSKNLTSYISAYRPVSDDNVEFDRLYRLVKLMQTMTIGYKDETCGEILDVDLDVVAGTAAYQSRGRTTVVPTKESYSSCRAILKFAMEWMLGRNLDMLQVDDSDSVAAACLAIEAELDGEGVFEEVFRDASALV